MSEERDFDPAADSYGCCDDGRAFDFAAARTIPGYWYLASPYSKFPKGFREAFRQICEIGAALVRQGIPIFSPIAHNHPLAMWGGIDPLDHTIWLPLDFPMIDAAYGLIVAQMDGWTDSYGIGVEIERFTRAQKPIAYLDPTTLKGEIALANLDTVKGEAVGG
jgi:hypothetical protein